MEIPRLSENITIEWLNKILNISINTSTFHKTSNLTADVGSLSNITRVEFEENSSKEQMSQKPCSTSKEQKDKPISSYIIKLLPAPSLTNGNIIQVMLSDKFDQKEIFFYKTLLPELLSIDSELQKYFCKFYYGAHSDEIIPNSTLAKESEDSQEYSSVLVLQDLSPLGYTMPRFNSGLSTRQLQALIEALSKIHFAGRVLQNKLGGTAAESILSKYELLNDWRYPTNNRQVVVNEMNLFKIYQNLEWFQLGLNSVIEDLLIPNNASQEMIEAYKQLIPVAPKILLKVFQEGQKFPTIFHDDLWPHNFLVCETNEDDPIKIIDWQLIGWLDSMYDLSHCLLACLPIDKLNQTDINTELDYYLDKYYRNHSQYDQKYKISKMVDSRNNTECRQFFWTYGLGYSCIWFSSSADSIYANSSYKPKLYRIYEYLWEMKIPEFLLQII